LASKRKASATHMKDFFGKKNGHIMSSGFFACAKICQKVKKKRDANNLTEYSHFPF
jgi:hypothetical protein